MSWNQLNEPEPPETSWNHLEQAGTTYNELEPPEASWNHLERAGIICNDIDLVTNWYKKQKIIGRNCACNIIAQENTILVIAIVT